jgi:hypothetical protein
MTEHHPEPDVGPIKPDIGPVLMSVANYKAFPDTLLNPLLF